MILCLSPLWVKSRSRSHRACHSSNFLQDRPPRWAASSTTAPPSPTSSLCVLSPPLVSLPSRLSPSCAGHAHCFGKRTHLASRFHLSQAGSKCWTSRVTSKFRRSRSWVGMQSHPDAASNLSRRKVLPHSISSLLSLVSSSSLGVHRLLRSSRSAPARVHSWA